MNDAIIDDYLSWVDRETEVTMSDENALTSSQTDLVLYEDETPAAMMQWANDPTQAWAMADALMSMHPNAKDVGVEGMRMVAQLALLTGANPLPGTNGIHVWRDKEGKICTSFGIGFWRNERDRAGGIVWVIPHD